MGYTENRQVSLFDRGKDPSSPDTLLRGIEAVRVEVANCLTNMLYTRVQPLDTRYDRVQTVAEILATAHEPALSVTQSETYAARVMDGGLQHKVWMADDRPGGYVAAATHFVYIDGGDDPDRMIPVTTGVSVMLWEARQVISSLASTLPYAYTSSISLLPPVVGTQILERSARQFVLTKNGCYPYTRDREGGRTLQFAPYSISRTNYTSCFGHDIRTYRGPSTLTEHPDVSRVERSTGPFHFRFRYGSARLDKKEILERLTGDLTELKRELAHHQSLAESLGFNSGIYHIVPPQRPSPGFAPEQDQH